MLHHTISYYHENYLRYFLVKSYPESHPSKQVQAIISLNFPSTKMKSPSISGCFIIYRKEWDRLKQLIKRYLKHKLVINWDEFVEFYNSLTIYITNDKIQLYHYLTYKNRKWARIRYLYMLIEATERGYRFWKKERRTNDDDENLPIVEINIKNSYLSLDQNTKNEIIVNKQNDIGLLLINIINLPWELKMIVVKFL